MTPCPALARTLAITLLHLGAAGIVSVHAALHKRNLRSAIGWIGFAWFVPLAGPLFYFLLGINRIRRTGAALGLEAHAMALEDDGRPSAHDRMPHSGFAGLSRLAETLTRRRLTAGNTVDVLVDGDGAYPAMLAAIDAADRSVSLSSYIFDRDPVGLSFAEALKRARDRGVAVRVLIDALGERYSRVPMTRLLADQGIVAARFLPTRGRTFFRYANLRNHRKILVVDGRTGFTGGMNIRGSHLLSAAPAAPIRDLHFRISGPIVADLQRTFAVDWAFTTGERLTGPDWFAPADPAGPVYARGIVDGPDANIDRMQTIMLGALAAAQYRISVVTPYFLPDEALAAALQTAALRGVRVDIILPEESNIPVMDWAMRPQLADFIDHGCRIYLSPPPFDHAKIFVVDGVWSLIGSTNWDPRSLRLNFEYNLECYDQELAGKLTQAADLRLGRARSLNAAELRALPTALRLRDGFARLLTPYL